MSVVVRHRGSRTRFTQVSNDAARDRDLTLKARGLLVMLLSFPDGWETSERTLAAQCQEGRASIRSGLQELEDAGYLHRGEQVRREDGTLGPIQWEVTDEPASAPWFDYPTTGEPTTAEPTAVESTTTNKERTNTDGKKKDRATRAKVDITDEGPSRELAELFARGMDAMEGVKAPDVDHHLIDGMASVRIVARREVDDDVDSDLALAYVIRWMFTVDDFWRYRVHSPKKLRDHFDTMWRQALAHYNKQRGSSGVRSDSGRSPPTQPSRNFGDGYIRIPDDHPRQQRQDNDDDERELDR